MKKIILILSLILLIQVAHKQKAMAQTDKKNVFKINLLSPVVSTLSVFYERTLSESTSAQLGLFYTGASADDTEFRGFGITPEIRFYLSDKGAPQGFFVAPYIRYQNFDLTYDDPDTDIDSEAKLQVFGGGVLVGGQWLFKDLITLDIWAGPSYASRNLEVDTGEEDDFSTGSLDGFSFRFGTTLGIAF